MLMSHYWLVLSGDELAKNIYLYSCQMTSILRDWLQRNNVSWNKTNKLEEEFSNGYLIGKLLCNLNVGSLHVGAFESKFKNVETVEVCSYWSKHQQLNANEEWHLICC